MEINLASYLVLCALSLLTAFVYWLYRRQDYFKTHKVPYVDSTPLLGSFGDAFIGKTGIYEQIEKIYQHPNVKGKPYYGMFLFHKPGLMITEPELIKRMFVKDFSSFSNRYSSSGDHDPLGYYNLFSIKAPMWKTVRGKLSPFFSSGKLKSMFYLIDRVSNEMISHVQRKVKSDNKAEVEVKELASLYTTDAVSNCAFGVDANSLRNSEGDFRKAGQHIFKVTFWRSFEFPAFFMLPQIMKFFGFKAFSAFGSSFIENSVTQVMAEREKTGLKRNDLIDTLIELKNSPVTTGGQVLSMDMLMAQAAVFFAAGHETSSALTSFALYEIARNKDIQSRLRNEIKDMLVRTKGEVTYDAVMNASEMPYFNQVFQETLRLYSVIPWLDRCCSEPEGYSLEPYGDFTIPYGMPIYVPFFAIHRDEKNYPNPLKFDPERFSPENIGDIKPFTFLPFGVGPRNCVGERFGTMQAKTGIVKILKEFRLETTANTPKEITIEKGAIMIQNDKGLFMDMVKDPLYFE